jgi:hypothetical protein
MTTPSSEKKTPMTNSASGNDTVTTYRSRSIEMNLIQEACRLPRGWDRGVATSMGPPGCVVMVSGAGVGCQSVAERTLSVGRFRTAGGWLERSVQLVAEWPDGLVVHDSA